VLDHTDRLIERASVLPGLIKHRGLRMEAAVIVSMAESLAYRLRVRDPMKKRVELAAHQKMYALARGIARGFGAS